MVAFAENILWLLVLIGVMIMIHELGHFWAARFFDVKVEAFSFGFGPRLFGFRRGETDYRFSAILIGGYVKMAGELLADDAGKRRDPSGLLMGGSSDSSSDAAALNDPRSLLAKPRWQRLIIAFAGPAMNILLAIGLLTGLYMVKYERISPADLQAVIGHVVPDAPAAKAGIQDGDRIVALDGKQNPTWEDVGLKEVQSAGQPLSVTVERAGKRFDTTVTPTYSQTSGMGYAGWDERGQIELGDVEHGFPAEKAGLKKGDIIVSVNGQPIHSQFKFQEITKNSGGNPVVVEYQRKDQSYTVSVQPVFAKVEGPAKWMIGVLPVPKYNLITTRLPFPAALRESLHQNVKGAMVIGQLLRGVAERRMSAKNVLTGPIGLGQLSGEAAREGPSTYFMLMSMVSLNLAIFNLLPIPILDGGTVLMLLIEMVMQRDMSLNVKEAVFKVGFVFIMMLLAFVIYNDISRMLPTG
jgi:regulator of sigma E protease